MKRPDFMVEVVGASALMAAVFYAVVTFIDSDTRLHRTVTRCCEQTIPPAGKLLSSSPLEKKFGTDRARWVLEVQGSWAEYRRWISANLSSSFEPSRHLILQPCSCAKDHGTWTRSTSICSAPDRCRCV